MSFLKALQEVGVLSGEERGVVHGGGVRIRFPLRKVCNLQREGVYKCSGRGAAW